MNNERYKNKTEKIKAYAVIYKPFGYTVCDVELIKIYESTSFWEVKEIQSGRVYIVKDKRVFRRKIDAIKRKNTITNLLRTRGKIPSLI